MKLLKGWALLVGLLALAQPLHAHERSLSTTTVDSLKLQQPFKGHFYCPETKVHLYLDLYEESIEVPGFSFLGKMQGYMEGGIYGTWMLMKYGPTSAKSCFVSATTLAVTHKTLSLRKSMTAPLLIKR